MSPFISIRRSSFVALGLVALAGCKAAPAGNETVAPPPITPTAAKPASDIDASQVAEAPEKAAQVAAQGKRMVRIGLDGLRQPGCGTKGIVTVAETPVRDRPDASGTTIERLPSPLFVAVCDRSDDRRWLGVVYATEGDPYTSCLTDPPTRRGRYSGPCRSGWVPAASVGPRSKTPA